MKLLLLEDDDETRDNLARALGAAGYVVDIALDGPEAIFLATTGGHAVLILDRMVPGIDGLTVLRAVRAAGVQTPALFLTARGGIGERVEGFEAGGDDYVVKPYATAELLARVAALARRRPMSTVVTRLEAGELVMDLIARSVTRGGRRIELQQQEFKLLEYLMRHAGQVVTRTMLLESVWDFHFDPGTNLIESHMSRLRRKIDAGHDEQSIHTVRGVGYRLDATAHVPMRQTTEIDRI